METLHRNFLIEMCEHLGHDPNRVARIVIDPVVITVEYVHPIVEKEN